MRRPSKSAAKKSVAAGRADATKRTPANAEHCGARRHRSHGAQAQAGQALTRHGRFFQTLRRRKLGFVPNVLKAFAFDMTKLEAFVAYRNDLMLGDSGLSKLEREMIATAVSAHNRCYYCITAHGAAVRYAVRRSGARRTDRHELSRGALDKRQRAMLDFAVKLTVEPWLIEEADRERLRKAGFSDRDIWDIAAVAAFYNMTNRLASATDMRPNSQYHSQGR